jgi:hypothetical protein
VRPSGQDGYQPDAFGHDSLWGARRRIKLLVQVLIWLQELISVTKLGYPYYSPKACGAITRVKVY